MGETNLSHISGYEEIVYKFPIVCVYVIARVRPNGEHNWVEPRVDMVHDISRHIQYSVNTAAGVWPRWHEMCGNPLFSCYERTYLDQAQISSFPLMHTAELNFHSRVSNSHIFQALSICFVCNKSNSMCIMRATMRLCESLYVAQLSVRYQCLERRKRIQKE